MEEVGGNVEEDVSVNEEDLNEFKEKMEEEEKEQEEEEKEIINVVPPRNDDVEEIEVGQYPLNAEFVVDESIFL